MHKVNSSERVKDEDEEREFFAALRGLRTYLSVILAFQTGTCLVSLDLTNESSKGKS